MIRFVFFGIAVLALMGSAAFWSEGKREARKASTLERETAEESVPEPSKPTAVATVSEAPPEVQPRQPAPAAAVARSRAPDEERQIVPAQPFLPEAPAGGDGSDEVDGDGGETVVAHELVDPDESAALIRRLLAVYDAVRE